MYGYQSHFDETGSYWVENKLWLLNLILTSLPMYYDVYQNHRCQTLGTKGIFLEFKRTATNHDTIVAGY